MQDDEAHPTAPRRLEAQRGFSLIEVMIGMSVLSMASLFTLSVAVTSVGLDKANRAEADATAAATWVLEEMQAVPLSQVFASFNTDPADDPAGPGTAIGNAFTVVASSQRVLGAMSVDLEAGEGEGPVGEEELAQLEEELGAGIVNGVSDSADTDATLRKIHRAGLLPISVAIEFPVNEQGQLVETATHPAFAGRSFDLDGNGSRDGDDRSGDYRLLPVVIRCSWTANGRTCNFTLAHILTDR